MAGGVSVGPGDGPFTEGKGVALRAVVVGGGIGGIAAAVALVRAGIDVQVHEQAQQLAEVGAGVSLAPNGRGRWPHTRGCGGTGRRASSWARGGKAPAGTAPAAS